MNEQPVPQPNQQPDPNVYQPQTNQAVPTPVAPAAPTPVAPSPATPSPYEAAPPSSAAPVSPSYGQQIAEAPVSANNTPDSWPGAFGIYKYSKTAVRIVLVTLLAFWLLTIVTSALFGELLKGEAAPLGDLLSFIISAVTTAGLTIAEISGARGQKISFGETFSKSLPFLLPMISLNILVALISAISLLLLIIPFFFVFPRLILSTYYLVDQKLGVIGSIKASWAATKGNVGKVYGIFGASLAMMLLAVTIIGIPFAVYFLIMYSAAFAILYEFVRKQQASVSSPMNP